MSARNAGPPWTSTNSGHASGRCRAPCPAGKGAPAGPDEHPALLADSNAEGYRTWLRKGAETTQAGGRHVAGGTGRSHPALRDDLLPDAGFPAFEREAQHPRLSLLHHLHHARADAPRRDAGLDLTHQARALHAFGHQLAGDDGVGPARQPAQNPRTGPTQEPGPQHGEGDLARGHGALLPELLRHRVRQCRCLGQRGLGGEHDAGAEGRGDRPEGDLAAQGGGGEPCTQAEGADHHDEVERTHDQATPLYRGLALAQPADRYIATAEGAAQGHVRRHRAAAEQVRRAVGQGGRVGELPDPARCPPRRLLLHPHQRCGAIDLLLPDIPLGRRRGDHPAMLCQPGLVACGRRAEGRRDAFQQRACGRMARAEIAGPLHVAGQHPAQVLGLVGRHVLVGARLDVADDLEQALDLAGQYRRVGHLVGVAADFLDHARELSRRERLVDVADPQPAIGAAHRPILDHEQQLGGRLQGTRRVDQPDLHVALDEIRVPAGPAPADLVGDGGAAAAEAGPPRREGFEEHAVEAARRRFGAREEQVCHREPDGVAGAEGQVLFFSGRRAAACPASLARGAQAGRIVQHAPALQVQRVAQPAIGGEGVGRRPQRDGHAAGRAQRRDTGQIVAAQPGVAADHVGDLMGQQVFAGCARRGGGLRAPGDIGAAGEGPGVQAACRVGSLGPGVEA